MSSLVGKGVKRIDAYDKVTGKGLYASDFFNQFPVMGHMKAFRSPYAHAKIKSIDYSKAKALPGVYYILTGYEEGVDWNQFPKMAIIAKDEALWAGQAIAIVAAETVEIAEQAVALIAESCEFEVLPFVSDYYEAIKPDPVSVVDPEYETRDQGFQDRPADRATNRVSPNIVGAFYLHSGDVDAGMKEADVILEDEFSTGKKTASPLECANATCRYESDGGLTMWSNGCGVHGVIKEHICRVLGMPESKVRVIQPYLGGSFGSRLSCYVEILVALMAMKAKRSVSWQFTREEVFNAAPSNWACVTKVKLGAKKDGTLVANDYYLCEEIGACVNNTFFSGRLSSSGVLPVYNFQNLRMDTYAIATNTVPAAEYRGLGCPEAEWGIEITMNRLAEKLGMSPVELRLKNMIMPGDRDAHGELITSTGLHKCLRAVADAIKVEEKPEQDPNSPWKIGRGCACGGKQNTPLGRSEAKVKYNSDGTIELMISCDENGMGATTTMGQICANEFGVAPEDVKVIKGDTAITPYDNYSASSRTTYTTGNAVIAACKDCIDKLKEEIARAYGLHPSKVEIKGKTAYLKGTYVQEIHIPSEFKHWSMFTQGNWGLQQYSAVEGHGIYCPAPIIQWDKNGLSKRVWNWFQYSACAVEVAVNEETGQIKVLKIASAADTGNPINPKLVEGQIEGGVHMAIGFSVNEEHLYHPETGAQWNANFSDYRLPTIEEMPTNENVHALICPDPLPDGPYGAKGMAESITIPVGPAIQEAIYQAVGVQLNHYPMTAERVFAKIKEKKEAEK
ncbi:MAG: xanthine dehydrogenase family protein molybdopterin-binding subunit [Clostridia bacterium]|nr:xanthine dehydrogenase family protein molybdopterin-binding subunit [Clostridia bacterium]